MTSILFDFTIFYLLIYWVVFILCKDNWIPRKLENLGNWFKQRSILSNFFLGVSECKFCFENHTATIGAIAYYSYCLDYRVLIWGFLYASINSWLREFFK